MPAALNARFSDPLVASPGSKIALFIPSFGDGGVERMLVNLAQGFSAHGAQVDFLVKDRSVPYLDSLGPSVRIIELGVAQPSRLLAGLLDYLARERPAVLMSGKIRDDRIAIAASERKVAPTRMFVRIGTSLAARQEARRRNPLKRWLNNLTARRLCRKAEGVICVSQGVADDLASIVSLPASKLHVLRNPVVTPQLAGLAKQPVDHPWFAPGEPPVILGAGGLRMQKNFSMLIRAFAAVRARTNVRLMIIGEGRQRERLLKLTRRLGIADAVALPGFVANPYAYMAKAALFVLSSDWEGSPNVLAEALAVGTPVVSTDCPSGPREILQAGRFGPLVPTGDERALVQAMLATLAAPHERAFLQSAAMGYTLEKSSEAYLRAFGLWSAST